MTGLIGNAGTPRFMAALLDNAVGVVLFFLAAMNLSELIGNVPTICAAVGAYFGYYFLTEWLLGSTPGKKFFGLTVCGIQGERCSARQAAIRTAIRVIDMNPLIGAFPAGVAILTTRRHQRLGDLLAGTVVVRQTELARWKVTMKAIESDRDAEIGVTN